MNSIRRRAGTTAISGVLALVVLSGGMVVGTAAAASAAPASTGASTSHAQTTDFGYLGRLCSTGSSATISLDRAIMYTGAAAAAQRAKRGLHPDAPEFYIANDNPRLRTYHLAPGVVVHGSQVLTGSPAAKTVSLATLRRYLEQRPKGSSGVPFTLTFDRRGRVTQIAEMYLP